MNYFVKDHKKIERKKFIFWLIVGTAWLTSVIVYRHFFPGLKCLKSETTTTIETYYDFGQSGMGIWQAPSTKTICVEWEKTPSK